MTNFNEKFFFNKTFIVNNPKSVKKIVTDNNYNNLTIGIEGGNLINNIKNNIAVQLQNNTNKNWNGYLYEKGNLEKPILEFISTDENIATFNFVPDPKKNYEIKINNNQQNTISLPIGKNSGVALVATTVDDGLKFKINKINFPKSIKIIGTIGNQLIYKANIPASSSEEIEKTISTKDLISGIITLSIFDENENLIAQRLNFINNKKLSSNFQIDEINLSKEPREFSSVRLKNNTDNNIKDVITFIVDKNTKTTEEIENISSRFFLTGDLDLNLNQPSQYFTNLPNEKIINQILIGKKWDRINWEELKIGKLPILKKNDNRYLSYDGQLKTKNNTPIKNTKFTSIINKSNGDVVLKDLQTDENGYFTLDNIIFEDEFTFNYTKDNKNNDTRITFTPKSAFRIPFTINTNEILAKYNLVDRSTENNENNEDIDNHEDRLALQNILKEKYIDIEHLDIKKTKSLKSKTEELNDKLANGMFNSMVGSVRTFDFVNSEVKNSLLGMSNVFEYLNIIYPHLAFNETEGILQDGKNGANPFYYYLNESRVPKSTIESIPLEFIAMAKVFQRGFAGNPGMAGGAVAVYTLKGDLLKEVNDRSYLKKTNNNIITLKGYDSLPNFILPDYSNKDLFKNQKDNRKLLYWNPNTSIKNNKSSEIKFVNNDSPSNYKIIVVGFNPNSDTPIYKEELL